MGNSLYIWPLKNGISLFPLKAQGGNHKITVAQQHHTSIYQIFMASIKHWVMAFRLRTLPLALASIGMGGFLAAYLGAFRWEVFALSALTTIFLQILSNLANDYGDSQHGADSAEREGPARAVQAGLIARQAMKKAIVVFAFLSFLCGLTLLYVALGHERLIDWGIFLGMGILAIVAAITYTAGYKPYGYAGLGDLSVMIFFGWVGVLGSCYLYTPQLSLSFLLPATSCGFFATAVLNVNNIRDIKSDQQAGKRSVPVRIGRQNARIYHAFLLIGGVVCALGFVALHFQSAYQLIFLVMLPAFWKNGQAVFTLEQPAALDPFLKQMALSAFFFTITFGLGLLIAIR
jgi:1,4-dihydroxy-2-naphthoate octaprenyltransferase